jgi:hypothetical protein
MRKLSSKELTNGIFVQVDPESVVSCKSTVYQILIKSGEHFYKAKDSDWEMNGELVKDNWYETELTKALNREEKLNELGI